MHALETGKLIRKFSLEIGQIVAFSGSRKNSEIFYQLVSFLTPGTIYQYDFAKPDVEPSLLREVKLNLEGFDKNNFIVEQVFYSSRDGTKIPMFIVQKKSGKKGPKPSLLYGYGGFNISLLPTFSVSLLFFVDAFDGVLAFPNIRGGGEYGQKWHNSGRLLKKQNGFDDFQAAAEYLVQHNYTVHKKIAIQGLHVIFSSNFRIFMHHGPRVHFYIWRFCFNMSFFIIFQGGSNGGLLVGACINQRSDLFGAAVAQVGVMDMLRFHKFTVISSIIINNNKLYQLIFNYKFLFVCV